MSVVALVQARTGSRRLPRKVLMDLAGQPVLARVLERARRIPGVDLVAVATTALPRDEPIVDLAESLGCPAFRGDESDVLDRYYQAARCFSARVVVRITADCPLLDPEVSGAVVARFAAGDADYVSNVHPRTFPQGLDTEACSFAALEQAWREATAPYDREHVTPYLWRQPERFRLANCVGPGDLSARRWTVDYPQDLAMVRAVYAELPAGRSDYGAVLAVLAADPGIEALNQDLVAGAPPLPATPREASP